MPDRGTLITREELYELVWAKPMIKVAERFGVSGSYLARVCSNLKVPRPQRGYWAKLAAGKAPNAKDLPPALPGDEITWTPGTTSAEVMRASDNSHKRFITKRMADGLAPGSQKEHSLIADSRSHFENSDATSRIGFLKPSKRNLPNIVVTRPLLEQAMTFANDLFLTLERRGHRVVLGSPSESIQRPAFDPRETPNKQNFYDNHWSPGRQTLAYINGTPIGILLYELTESTVMHYVNGKYIRDAEFHVLKRRVADHQTWASTQDVPSGRFGLILYTSFYDRRWLQCWKESKPGQLIKSVLALARKVEAAQPEAQRTIDEGRERHERSQIEWALSQEKWRAEEAERKLKKAVSDSKDELLQIIQTFEKADYTDNVLRRLTAASEGLSETERERFEELMKEAKTLLGPEPDIQCFLSWKPPRDRL